jgi:4-hydroxyproline epimerase
MIEEGLIQPKTPGVVRCEVPAGIVTAYYAMNGPNVESVRLVNVPSFLHSAGLDVDCPGLGRLRVDVAFGGNFYAIVDPQENFRDMDQLTAGDMIRLSPIVRRQLNERHEFIHPLQPSIQGLSHVQWTGRPRTPGADARNAVFYGEKAIDRSPCGTGTSARMAQLAAKGRLRVGDTFIHESIIGSIFHGRVEEAVTVGTMAAIIPSIEGWARITGHNKIFIDDRDPYRHGFQVL